MFNWLIIVNVCVSFDMDISDRLFAGMSGYFFSPVRLRQTPMVNLLGFSRKRVRVFPLVTRRLPYFSTALSRLLSTAPLEQTPPFRVYHGPVIVCPNPRPPRSVVGVVAILSPCFFFAGRVFLCFSEPSTSANH